jgi:hypothetical protein
MDEKLKLIAQLLRKKIKRRFPDVKLPAISTIHAV